MILVWLAEKITNELKDNYFDGNIKRVIDFIKKEKQRIDGGQVFVRIDEILVSPPDGFDMLEQGISEIESALLVGKKSDLLNLKYAYLNLIEAYSLLKEGKQNGNRKS